MTMATATRSAFPPALADLIPAVQAEVDRTGQVPSRNALMRTYRIGSDKARAVLAELDTTGAVTAVTPAPVEDSPASLPDPEPTTETTEPAPVAEPPLATPEVEATALPAVAVDPDTHITTTEPMAARRPVVWPVLLLCLPAFVAIWSGWVELGGLAGFGIVHPLPGIADDFMLNTAITLPIGVETYAAYALWVWLSGRAAGPARRFAKWSAIGSLMFGGLGQVAYHLLNAAGLAEAPWPITAAVACLPVAVLGMGAALAHLQHADQH